MKNSFIALFLLLPALSHAQVKVTLYYSKAWQLTKKDSAWYVRTAAYDTNNYYFDGPVEDRYARGYLSGELQMKGNYVAGIKEGEFSFYHENGHLESVGKFESNARSGLWKYFYRNNKPRAQLEYTPVFGDEPNILFLNDSTGKQILHNGTGNWFEIVPLISGGQLTIHGQYKDNQKTGKWTLREPKSKTVIVENFNKGRFLNGYVKVGNQGTDIFEPQEYSHPVPDKLKYTEEFHAAKGADFNTYPQLKFMLRNEEPVVNYIWDEGDPVFTKPEVSATPPGGLTRCMLLSIR
ncbi:MAG: hypothetical protein WDO15_12785 [Bacteroidota bacterium]